MDNNPQEAEEALPQDAAAEAKRIEELIKFTISRARKTCNRVDTAQATPEELYSKVARLLPLNNETQAD